MKSSKIKSTWRFIPVLFLTLSLAFAVIMWVGCTPSTGIRYEEEAGLSMAPKVISLPAASAKDGYGEVIFIADVRYTDIQFIKTQEDYSTELEFSFALADKEGMRQVRLQDLRKAIRVQSLAETLDRDKYVRMVERMEVPAGDYSATIVGLDRNTVTPGRITQSISVKDYSNELAISEPLLFADSVAAFQLEGLMPLDRHDFKNDFYAFVVVGGLHPKHELTLKYDLRDANGAELYQNSIQWPVENPIANISLRVPVNKLAFGKTMLNIVAEHDGEEVSASTTIQNYGDKAWQTKEAISSLIDPMRYVMEEDEWEALKQAPPPERLRLLKRFWQERNPNRHQEENSLLVEFARRVEEANTHFYWGNRQGWRTDRGRTLIVYGPPDEVQRKTEKLRTRYEIWRYDEIGREFVFVDTHGSGDFKLVRPGDLRLNSVVSS